MSWRPDIRFLVIPGLRGSGPDHWQTHWESALPATRIHQDDWSNPDLEKWADRIVSASLTDPRPAVLIAHSFGCLATIAAWPRLRHAVHAVMLVAPANPQRFGNVRLLTSTALTAPSILVASRNDPWTSYADAEFLARRWRSELVDAGYVGHINASSGHAIWAEGLNLLNTLLGRASLPPLRPDPVHLQRLSFDMRQLQYLL